MQHSLSMFYVTKISTLFQENGATKYGIVKGYIRNNELDSFVMVNMGNGHSIMFKSIEAIEAAIEPKILH